MTRDLPSAAWTYVRTTYVHSSTTDYTRVRTYVRTYTRVPVYLEYVLEYSNTGTYSSTLDVLEYVLKYAPVAQRLAAGKKMSSII